MNTGLNIEYYTQPIKNYIILYNVYPSFIDIYIIIYIYTYIYVIIITCIYHFYITQYRRKLNGAFIVRALYNIVITLKKEKNVKISSLIVSQRILHFQCLEFAENEEAKCRRNYSISAEREIIKDFNQTPVPEGRLVWYQESSGIRYRTLPARGPWMAMTAVKGHLSLYMVESATKCIARAGRRKTKGARPSRGSLAILSRRSVLIYIATRSLEIMPCRISDSN